MKKSLKVLIIVFLTLLLVFCVALVCDVVVLLNELPDGYFTCDEWTTHSLEVTLKESFAKSEDFSIEKLEDMLADLPIVRITPLPDTRFSQNEYQLKFDCDNKWYLIYLKLRVEKIDGIQKVGFYHVAKFLSVPNDNYYSLGYLRGLDNIEIEKVWDYFTGMSSVRVGIIDSGIYNHDDLTENIVKGYLLRQG